MSSYANCVITLDKASPIPLYRQIKDHIRSAIVSGAWMEGFHLPSERELTMQLDISRITVRQALTDLAKEGLITSAAGKGYYVAATRPAEELDALVSFSSLMQQRGVTTRSRVLSCVVQWADPALAGVLGIAAGSEVVSLNRVRLVNGLPVAEQKAWIPHDLTPEIATNDFSTASVFTLFRERYGLRLVRAETSISARIADRDEAAALELPEPFVALAVDQKTFEASGRIVEYSRSLHHPLRLPVQVTQALVEADGRIATSAAATPTR
jgi:GntR family transcriptional regulator